MERETCEKSVFTIDRFESDVAVLEGEDGQHRQVFRRQIEECAKENDCLILKDGIYKIDSFETEKRRLFNVKMQKDLFE